MNEDVGLDEGRHLDLRELLCREGLAALTGSARLDDVRRRFSRRIVCGLVPAACEQQHDAEQRPSRRARHGGVPGCA